MGGFGWITRLIGGLWDFSRRSWIDTGLGLRPGSSASALVIFLFLIFFLIGTVLMLLGIHLNDVDRWLEAQAGWLDLVFSWLFRIVCGLVILLCAFAVFGAIFDRKNPEKPGIGCALLALVVAYFAWFGMVYP